MSKLRLLLICVALGLFPLPAPAKALPGFGPGDLRADASPAVVRIHGARRVYAYEPRYDGFYFGPRLGFFRPPAHDWYGLGYRDWAPPVCVCYGPYVKSAYRTSPRRKAK
jgi:hypothetical protein